MNKISFGDDSEDQRTKVAIVLPIVSSSARKVAIQPLLREEFQADLTGSMDKQIVDCLVTVDQLRELIKASIWENPDRLADGYALMDAITERVESFASIFNDVDVMVSRLHGFTQKIWNEYTHHERSAKIRWKIALSSLFRCNVLQKEQVSLDIVFDAWKCRTVMRRERKFFRYVISCKTQVQRVTRAKEIALTNWHTHAVKIRKHWKLRSHTLRKIVLQRTWWIAKLSWTLWSAATQREQRERYWSELFRVQESESDNWKKLAERVTHDRNLISHKYADLQDMFEEYIVNKDRDRSLADVSGAVLLKDQCNKEVLIDLMPTELEMFQKVRTLLDALKLTDSAEEKRDICLELLKQILSIETGLGRVDVNEMCKFMSIDQGEGAGHHLQARLMNILAGSPTVDPEQLHDICRTVLESLAGLSSEEARDVVALSGPRSANTDTFNNMSASGIFRKDYTEGSLVDDVGESGLISADVADELINCPGLLLDLTRLWAGAGFYESLRSSFYDTKNELLCGDGCAANQVGLVLDECAEYGTDLESLRPGSFCKVSQTQFDKNHDEMVHLELEVLDPTVQDLSNSVPKTRSLVLSGADACAAFEYNFLPIGNSARYETAHVFAEDLGAELDAHGRSVGRCVELLPLEKGHFKDAEHLQEQWPPLMVCYVASGSVLRKVSPSFRELIQPLFKTCIKKASELQSQHSSGRIIEELRHDKAFTEDIARMRVLLQGAAEAVRKHDVQEFITKTGFQKMAEVVASNSKAQTSDALKEADQFSYVLMGATVGEKHLLLRFMTEAVNSLLESFRESLSKCFALMAARLGPDALCELNPGIRADERRAGLEKLKNTLRKQIYVVGTSQVESFTSNGGPSIGLEPQGAALWSPGALPPTNSLTPWRLEYPSPASLGESDREAAESIPSDVSKPSNQLASAMRNRLAMAKAQFSNRPAFEELSLRPSLGLERTKR